MRLARERRRLAEDREQHAYDQLVTHAYKQLVTAEQNTAALTHQLFRPPRLYAQAPPENTLTRNVGPRDLP